MARPQKVGLDYFPLDVYTDQDDKVAIIEAKHGTLGFAIIIKLLMKIYSEGYYYTWSEKEQILFSKRVNEDINEVDAIIKDCVKWGMFDEGLFNQYSILTSNGIQMRYFEAAKRRLEVEVVNQYLLIDNHSLKEFKNLVDVNTNEVNVNINEEVVVVNDNISTQRKEEKRREENTIVNEEHQEIYNHWNDKDIIEHRKLTPRIEKSIIKAIKEYSIQDIKDAIDLYSEAYHSDYFYNYKHTLEEFLRQNNGAGDWIEEGSKYENYMEYKSKAVDTLKKSNTWGKVDAS